MRFRRTSLSLLVRFEAFSVRVCVLRDAIVPLPTKQTTNYSDCQLRRGDATGPTAAVVQM